MILNLQGHTVSRRPFLNSLWYTIFPRLQSKRYTLRSSEKWSLCFSLIYDRSVQTWGRAWYWIAIAVGTIPHLRLQKKMGVIYDNPYRVCSLLKLTWLWGYSRKWLATWCHCSHAVLTPHASPPTSQHFFVTPHTPPQKFHSSSTLTLDCLSLTSSSHPQYHMGCCSLDKLWTMNTDNISQTSHFLEGGSWSGSMDMYLSGRQEMLWLNRHVLFWRVKDGLHRLHILNLTC